MNRMSPQRLEEIRAVADSMRQRSTVEARTLSKALDDLLAHIDRLEQQQTVAFILQAIDSGY